MDVVSSGMDYDFNNFMEAIMADTPGCNTIQNMTKPIGIYRIGYLYMDLESGRYPFRVQIEVLHLFS